MPRQNMSVHRILGAALITTGIILYPTPIPGTTILIILGLIWAVEKTKTINFLKKTLGEKIFLKLKLSKIAGKLSKSGKSSKNPSSGFFIKA